MSKFQNTLTKNFSLRTFVSVSTLGSAAFLALTLAAPVTSAHAQGVPAGLLRLDSAQLSNENGQLAENERTQAKVRNAFARTRKNHVH
jgi:hypothetical protein